MIQNANLQLTTCIVEKKCGITSQMLYYENPFTVVFQELLSWINDCINEIQQNSETSYFSGMNLPLPISLKLNECIHTVLIAHNGFTFDFRILAAEIDIITLIYIVNTH